MTVNYNFDDTIQRLMLLEQPDESGTVRPFETVWNANLPFAPTLRHLLRQSAVINPGHYHYYVQFVRPGAVRNPDAEKAAKDANFDIYNLVTLYMGDAEMAALGKMLVFPDQKLRKEAEEIGAELKYFYYLSGPIGAGKTTCLSYLGSFKTYEEWMAARPIELAKSWKDLTDNPMIEGALTETFRNLAQVEAWQASWKVHHD